MSDHYWYLWCVKKRGCGSLMNECELFQHLLTWMASKCIDSVYIHRQHLFFTILLEDICTEINVFKIKRSHWKYIAMWKSVFQKLRFYRQTILDLTMSQQSAYVCLTAYTIGALPPISFSVICWFYATGTFQDLISRLIGLDYMDNHVVFSQFTQWIRMPSKSEMACQKSSHRILFSGSWPDLLWGGEGAGGHFVVIHILINFSHI